MRLPFVRPRAVIGSTALLLSGAALAHPSLLSSSPEQGAQVDAPARIELRFSEPLVTKMSGAKLIMTGMPGMADHPPMPMAVKVTGGDDPKLMLITPTQKLVPGSYSVQWRAVSSDTHPISGTVDFQVK